MTFRNHSWKKAKMEKISKPFDGLLRCGECGMMITAENKIKNYKNGTSQSFHYYRCTKKSRVIKCSQPYSATEESIHTQLTTLVKKYTLKNAWAIRMNKKLDEEYKNIAQSSLSEISLKRKEIDNLNSKLQLLLDSYLDQITDKEMYKEKKLELIGNRKTIEEQIISLETQKGYWIEPMRNWISEANGVDQIISTNNKEQLKVLAARIFGSNLYLEDKTVRGDGINGWSALGADRQVASWSLR